MPSSSGHTRKRQFQPSIDSFFTRDGFSSAPTNRLRPDMLLAPPLPEETQASLLSVGMRVRKSVPEGYKTHKTIGVHISPVPSSAPARSATKMKEKQQISAGFARELTPMCGLHKTGGLAVQHISSSAPATMSNDWEDTSEDDLPGLSMSQTTIQSCTDLSACSSLYSTKKRGYEEEIEEDLDAFFNNDMAMDSQMPLEPQPPRTMAKMKLPYRRDGRRVIGIMGGDDFDEAAFLVPDDMEVDF